jgi:2-dehydro-3-deoxyphosphogalactonate aldolase
MSAELVFRQALESLPLVAILRGLRPPEAVAVGQALWRSGWRMLEVPLNSPDPLQSIALLARSLPQALVGAGTVLSGHQVREVH